jgi:hypothetical protein
MSEFKFKGNEKEYLREYYLKNKDKFAGYAANQIAKDPERVREYKRAYKRRNVAKVKASNKAWAQRNAGKVTAYARAYQLAKQRAMPSCLTPEQVKQIEQFYVNRPPGYHVDHIMPLKGKNSSGLHVPWNLQYLRAAENIKKSNKVGS